MLKRTNHSKIEIVLEKGGECHLDRSSEKCCIAKCHIKKKIPHTVKIRKANYIGHIWRRNCLLNNVTEDRRKTHGTGRRGRSRTEVVVDLKQIQEDIEN